MGLLKLVAKSVGSVALSAAGAVSAIGKEICDITGADGLGEFFDTTKELSFGTAKDMWEDVDVGEELIETVRNIPDVVSTLASGASRSMSSQLNNMARDAEKNGDYDLLDRIEQKQASLDHFQDSFGHLQDTISNISSGNNNSDDEEY